MRGRSGERINLAPDRSIRLQENGRRACHDRHGKKRQTHLHVAGADLAPLPPGMEQDHRRPHEDRGLAEQRRHEERERPRVIPASPSLVEAQPGQHRRQQQSQRKRVLEFGNPRHRFDLDGMHHENQPAEPGMSQPQALEQSPEQPAAEQVQGDAREMECRRIPAESAPQQPLHRRLQWQVVGTDAASPDLEKSRGVLDGGVVGQLVVIVQQPAAAKNGGVDVQAGQKEHARLPRHAARPRDGRRFGSR